MSIKQLTKAALVVTLVSLAVVSVPAAILTPGSPLIPATPVAPVTGAHEIFSTTANFTSSSFTGVLTSSVYDQDANNPFGGLTFAYQFTLTSGPEAASQFTVTSFGLFEVDAGFSSSGTLLPLTAPTFLSRSVDGNVVRFGFFGVDVKPGETSALLIARTSAFSWTPSDAALIDGQSVNVASLAPLPIPEPGSLSLLAIGLGMLVFLRRQR
jgi:hypothetical protein